MSRRLPWTQGQRQWQGRHTPLAQASALLMRLATSRCRRQLGKLWQTAAAGSLQRMEQLLVGPSQVPLLRWSNAAFLPLCLPCQPAQRWPHLLPTSLLLQLSPPPARQLCQRRRSRPWTWQVLQPQPWPRQRRRATCRTAMGRRLGAAGWHSNGGAEARVWKLWQCGWQAGQEASAGSAVRYKSTLCAAA